MALSSCFSSSQLCVSMRIERSRLPLNNSCKSGLTLSRVFEPKSASSVLFGQQVVEKQKNQCTGWNFLGGSRIMSRPIIRKKIPCRKGSAVHASWLPSAEIASSAFTLGTAAVLPFYTFMVVAPKAEITQKLVESSIPYILLGLLYAYLLYLSWTPDTIRLMFASKYWLPELSGIAKMFSSEMTLASAWIHLLAVDLFAARQVYYDGLQENIETRHSVSLCLLFCPVGILAHFITKAISRTGEKTEHRTH